MKKVMIPVVLILLLLGAGAIVIKYYEYVFSKTVVGKIINVNRVTEPSTLITSGSKEIPSVQLFSFAVAIRDNQGEIHTASSEDRQWAVTRAGQCAEVRFFPYPPWDLQSWGTYHNARLIRLFECAETEGTPEPSPSPSPAPSSDPSATPAAQAPAA
jgi:hypothetical protein